MIYTNNEEYKVKFYKDIKYQNFSGVKRIIVQETNMVTPLQLYMYRLMNNLYYYVKWENKFTPSNKIGEQHKIIKNQQILIWNVFILML